MDGNKIPINNSLQRKLSIWLLFAVLGISTIAVIWSYYSAFNDAHDFQDDVLRQIAILFDQDNLVVAPDEDTQSEIDNDPEDHFFVQLLSDSSSVKFNKNAKIYLPLPNNLVDGFQSVNINGKNYRIFVKIINKNERLAVAQETEVRDEIAQWSSARALIPLLILVPILLVGISHLVRTLFKSVANVTRDIDARGEQEFYPISHDNLPVEIQPFVAAINRLLGRVEQSIEAQRRFVADAAHELRSPLTALSLQAERLANLEISVSAKAQVNILRQGITRSRELLTQLLALARSQVAQLEPDSAVSIQHVYRRVLEDLMPMAEQKNIDVGITTSVDVILNVSESDLICMIKNLVDNAIRYTPEGGRVDLSIINTHDALTLLVEDTGIGISEAERKRVFDPFYRILGNDAIGSGLGLSIVAAIAARIGASIAFDFSNQKLKSGLKVTIIFTK